MPGESRRLFVLDRPFAAYNKYDVMFIKGHFVTTQMPATPQPLQDPEQPEHCYAAMLLEGVKGQAKGERTRAAIQAAACRILDRTALSELTIAGICKEAGIAHGTFYIYFRDRQVLVQELTLGFIHFLQQVMRSASRHHPDDPRRAATEAYFLLFQTNPGLMKCLVNHLDSFPEAREAFQRLNREWLEAVVSSVEARLRREGRSDAIGHEELMRRAYALGGMTDQYLTGLFLSRDPTMESISNERAQVVDTLDLIWRRGLLP